MSVAVLMRKRGCGKIGQIQTSVNLHYLQAFLLGLAKKYCLLQTLKQQNPIEPLRKALCL